MKSKHRFWPVVLVLSLLLCSCSGAMAAVEDTGFSDVAANAWYADAAQYVRDNGVMSGTSSTTFSPDLTMTRAMLATVLYRAAGSPAVSSTADFRDVAADSWYSAPAAWAAENGVVSGYGDGQFGGEDPVTREQIATILWRYAGSPTPAGTETGFADGEDVSAYAVQAVTWAQERGMMNGMEGGRFVPKSRATRAQAAVILEHFLQEEPAPQPTPEEHKILVAYFSATGNTEQIARHLEHVLNADLYEIVPQQPYTDDDLNYNRPDSRAEQEINDPAARPAISGSVANMEDYDVVFIGYPIWWGQAPKIVSTFLESYDFSGKTIVPFCTSASSGIGGSLSAIQALAPDASWLSGQRFSGSATEDAVRAWTENLNLNQ